MRQGWYFCIVTYMYIERIVRAVVSPSCYKESICYVVQQAGETCRLFSGYIVNGCVSNQLVFDRPSSDGRAGLQQCKMPRCITLSVNDGVGSFLYTSMAHVLRVYHQLTSYQQLYIVQYGWVWLLYFVWLAFYVRHLISVTCSEGLCSSHCRIIWLCQLVLHNVRSMSLSSLLPKLCMCTWLEYHYCGCVGS